MAFLAFPSAKSPLPTIPEYILAVSCVSALAMWDTSNPELYASASRMAIILSLTSCPNPAEIASTNVSPAMLGSVAINCCHIEILSTEVDPSISEASD